MHLFAFSVKANIFYQYTSYTYLLLNNLLGANYSQEISYAFPRNYIVSSISPIVFPEKYTFTTRSDSPLELMHTVFPMREMYARLILVSTCKFQKRKKRKREFWMIFQTLEWRTEEDKWLPVNCQCIIGLGRTKFTKLLRKVSKRWFAYSRNNVDSGGFIIFINSTIDRSLIVLSLKIDLLFVF